MSESFGETVRAEMAALVRATLDGDPGVADDAGCFSHAAWRTLAGAGLTGLTAPGEYGGRPAPAVAAAEVLEALAHACRDGGLVFALAAHLSSGVVQLHLHGTPLQRARFLPRLCAGDWIACGAITEEEAGSDVLAMTTRATPDGGGFRLQGRKLFITNAPEASLAVVFAVTDPGGGFLGGLTAFLVECTSPGFRVVRRLRTLGLRTAAVGEIALDDVAVPAENVLGGVGAGGRLMTVGLTWERVLLAAVHVGTMERILESGVARARSRQQFGAPIGRFQAVAHALADSKVALDAGRQLVRQAAALLDAGRDAQLEACIAKLFTSEALVRGAVSCLEVHGAAGYVGPSDVERTVRDALASPIYAGSSSILRNTIARWLRL